MTMFKQSKHQLMPELQIFGFRDTPWFVVGSWFQADCVEEALAAAAAAAFLARFTFLYDCSYLRFTVALAASAASAAAAAAAERCLRFHSLGFKILCSGTSDLMISSTVIVGIWGGGTLITGVAQDT